MNRFILAVSMGCFLACGAAATGALAAYSGPEKLARSPGGPRDIDGVWWTPQPPRRFRPLDGQLPPFTPYGRAEYDRHVKADEAGTPIGDTAARCLPHGIPRLMGSPYPIQIITSPGQITTLHEAGHNIRLIYMDKAHAKGLPPAYLGHSIAHWEGDTLVVDTTGFTNQTRIDEEGITHSDKLHVVERIRKINDGAQLEDLFTIEDPVTFTKPWVGRRIYNWRGDLKLMEYVCDNNRNAPDEHNVTVAK